MPQCHHVHCWPPHSATPQLHPPAMRTRGASTAQHPPARPPSRSNPTVLLPPARQRTLSNCSVMRDMTTVGSRKWLYTHPLQRRRAAGAQGGRTLWCHRRDVGGAGGAPSGEADACVPQSLPRGSAAPPLAAHGARAPHAQQEPHTPQTSRELSHGTHGPAPHPPSSEPAKTSQRGRIWEGCPNCRAGRSGRAAGVSAAGAHTGMPFSQSSLRPDAQPGCLPAGG